MLTEGKYLKIVKIMGQVKDDTWRPKGSDNPNFQLDNRKYEAMFDVETLKEHSTNDIVDNIIFIIGYEDRYVLGLGGILKVTAGEIE